MSELTGVRAKFAAQKDAKSGTRSVTLAESAVECQVPNFINHGVWMRAQRLAKGDVPKAQVAFIAETVRFEGEKLTITDLSELVSASDMMQLLGEIFGSDDDEDAGDKGNGTAH